MNFRVSRCIGLSAVVVTIVLAGVASAQSPHTRDRANSYDDAWQSGTNGWVANAKAILANGTGQVPGMVLWIGDSLTRDPALGTWSQRGAGKTAEDQMIATWMHAGLSPKSIDSVDGFALATPYHCSARSYTVGDGLGSWHFMGTGMPVDTNPTTAKQKLENCTAYPNMLNLTTMLSALQKPQFAIPEVNLDAANPASFPTFDAMVNLMISKGIVPIIITYTYRGDAKFNLLVDQYNAALIQYAQTKKLPLIDFNREMLLRLPFSQWQGRFLGDGVHYTNGTTTYPSTSDPYANGGDPATHATGIALTYNGYGLKGWLGVQKMKEIKALVVDSQAPAIPTVTLSASPQTIGSGQTSTLTWSTTNATTVSINQGIGAVATSGNRAVNPTSTTTYTITSTAGGGTVTATATVTIAPGPTISFSGSPLTIASGQSSTLTWSTTNATTVSINHGVGSLATSGNRAVSPTSATTYTLTATGAGGTSAASVTVTVALPPTGTFNTDRLSIRVGDTTTLTWAVANATSVSIDQEIGAVAPSASLIVSPTTTTTYRLLATGTGGTMNASVTVEVLPAQADFMVYETATGYWGMLDSDRVNAVSKGWGGPGYLPVPADFDGDAKKDFALYHEASGCWYVLRSATNFSQAWAPRCWGGPGYTPVAGDYDGDGVADYAVYHEVSGTWYVLKSSTGNTDSLVKAWGGIGYKPVTGDYDGDRKTDFALYQPANGSWSVLTSGSNYTSAINKPWGGPGYSPVVGDFDGDGKTDMVVYYEAGESWHVLQSSGAFATAITRRWGGVGYAPVPEDFDGDGKADFAVYNNATGWWYVLKSSTSNTDTIVVPWGGTGYLALPHYPYY